MSADGGAMVNTISSPEKTKDSIWYSHQRFTKHTLCAVGTTVLAVAGMMRKLSISTMQAFALTTIILLYCCTTINTTTVRNDVHIMATSKVPQ